MTMPHALPASRDVTPQTSPEPFHFQTSLVLQEATGLRASRLSVLAKLLRTVPEACLYHHTHYFLLSHHYLTPEPSNDFAYWVTEVLGEEPLGELLSSVDIMEHTSLQSLREKFVGIIEGYLQRIPSARLKFASPGEEFYFVKSVHVIMPTPFQASTLAEFADALEKVSVHCLYFHIFAARLRVGRPSNDFALWVERLGYPALAKDLAQLDPYAHTLETLRSLLLSLVRRQLSQPVT